MKTKFIELNQDGVNLYLFKLNIKELIDIAIIEHFDSANNTGYQRPPFPAHYKKITKYLLNSSEAILPTAILAATEPNNVTLNNSELVIHNKIRIVDGQHRIEGVKALANGDEKSKERYNSMLETFEFPIILMEVPQDKKILEIDTFININSKGKRVSTNLAMQLREMEFSNKDDLIVDKEFCINLATSISKELANRDGIWKDKIILGNDIKSIKPISINAFSKSIEGIVQVFTTDKNEFNSSTEIDILREQVIQLINDSWKIIIDKWSECFIKDNYNEYNIRKGIGVYSLHGILKECLVNYGTDKAIFEFKALISESNVKSDSWLVGGEFAGMSSKQAIKDIIDKIKNKIK